MSQHVINKNKRPRCQHRTRAGRLCRMDAASDSKFCPRHASTAEDPVDPDLEAALTSGLEKIDSPAAITDLLSRLFRLLAQDRISPRRAAVLAYVSNQMLRSLHATAAEVERNKEPTHIEYVLGLRPDDVEPENPPPKEDQSQNP